MASTDNPLGINLAPTSNQVGAAGSPVTETTPPTPPSWQTLFTIGTPSTPPVSRGLLNNSYIAFTNNNLYHVCDFKLNIKPLNISLVSTDGFSTNPVDNSLQHLYGSVLAVGALLRTAFSSLAQDLRQGILDAIDALGLDPSGQISEAVSYAKHVLKIVNEYYKKIKQLIQDAQLIIAIVVLTEELIKYLESLPARVLKLVEGCITGFLQSVVNIPTTLSNVATGSIQQVLNQVQTTASQAQATIKSASSALSSSPPASLQGFIDPSAGSLPSVQDIQNAIGAITTDANKLLNSTQSALTKNTSGP